MGLIYSEFQCYSKIQDLEVEIENAKELLWLLKLSKKKRVPTIDGYALFGTSNLRGKGLFSELLLPTVCKLDEAIKDIESDLTKFYAANNRISHNGYLNEDILNDQINLLKNFKNSIDEAAKEFQNTSKKNTDLKLSELLKKYSLELKRKSKNFQENINMVDNQLIKLYDFYSTTSQLFETSVPKYISALRTVFVLNGKLFDFENLYSMVPESSIVKARNVIIFDKTFGGNNL